MSKDQLLDHESDGIQEYDNDLPRWWLYLFLFTIVWGGIYVVYFHFSGRPTPREMLDQEIAQGGLKSPAPQGGGESEKLNWAVLVADNSVRTLGKQVFLSKCAPCHLEQGQGLVGPNLTDDYWIHGGKPEQIHATIQNGVPEKGMVAWKALLKKDELVAVAAHVISLRGTHPPNPKAPQGNLEKR